MAWTYDSLLARQGRAHKAGRRRKVATAVGVGLAAAAATEGVATPKALAQSPAPNYIMHTAHPSAAYPTSGNAVVVFGGYAGMEGCSNFTYNATVDDIVKMIKAKHKTIAEIYVSYHGCGNGHTISRGVVKTTAEDIDKYVASHTAGSLRSQYWGGIALDEEQSFGFAVSTLKSINSHVAKYYSSHAQSIYDPSTEVWANDFPFGSHNWTAKNWNSLTTVAGARPMPQVYHQDVITDLLDPACSTYTDCANTVGVSAGQPAPWNETSYVAGRVYGAPQTIPRWGSTAYWVEKFHA